MECPNCKMNIKDDAQFCIHCGTNFGGGLNQNQLVNNTMNGQPASNVGQPLGATQMQTNTLGTGGGVCPSCGTAIKDGNHFCINCGARVTDQEINNPQPLSNQPSNQANAINPKPLTTNKPDREKYYRAYFGSSYDTVRNGSFSIGTLFFSWIWLLLYKLYSQAGSLFVTVLIVDVIGGIVTFIIPPLKGIVGLGTSIFTIIYIYNYAKEFNYYRMEKADKDIDDVFRNYVNEDDRIAACKRMGGVNVIILVLIIAYIGLPILLVFSVFSATSRTIDNSRKSTFLSTAKEYANRTKTLYAAQDVRPSKGKFDFENNYYVLIDGSSYNKVIHPLTNTYSSASANDYGYVLLESQPDSKYKYYICLVSKIGDNYYHVMGESDALERTDVQVFDKNSKGDFKSLCNVRTSSKGREAIQLLGNNQ